MDRVKKLVGTNLQALRKNRKLTLQELAELTGVSKSMLGEIERGATSPTITVLWKIADGLRVPFTQLIQDESPYFTLVREEDMDTFADGDAFTISSVFKYDPNKKFEIYQINIDPHTAHESSGHNKGVSEYILVHEGVMTITAGDLTFDLKHGDSLFFKGDGPHIYSNRGTKTTKAYSIISYENGL